MKNKIINGLFRLVLIITVLFTLTAPVAAQDFKHVFTNATFRDWIVEKNLALCSYPFKIQNKDGTNHFIVDSAGNVTCTGTFTYGSVINGAGIASILGLTVGTGQNSQLANLTVTNYGGTTEFTIDTTGKIQWGTGTSTGILGGAGVSTSTTQSLGAGSSGDKAFSFYLSSTSTTTSHSETGFYMCMNYGTSGSSKSL